MDQSDAEIAKQARAEFLPILEQACEILNRLKAHGLRTGWALTPDQDGRIRPGPIDIVRPL